MIKVFICKKCKTKFHHRLIKDEYHCPILKCDGGKLEEVFI